MTGDAAARARAAAAEQGAVVVRVRCSRCRLDDPPIAVVRRSSAGLVFDGHQAASAAEDELSASLQALLGGPVPFAADPRVVVLLEEPPGTDTDWPPRAGCSRHGIELYDADQLVETARSAEGDEPATFKPGPSRAGH